MNQVWGYSCAHRGMKLRPSKQANASFAKKSKRYSVTSTTNGRTKIIEAASIRKDIVLERLNGIEQNFVYHMDNE